VYTRYITDFSPGYGWDGITVAILAANNPIVVFLSAGLFGMLRAAAISMNFGKTISVDLITVLQGLIICFVAAPMLWKAASSFVRSKRDR
jgi:simple sugar transport system permease protein